MKAFGVVKASLHFFFLHFFPSFHFKEPKILHFGRQFFTLAIDTPECSHYRQPAWPQSKFPFLRILNKKNQKLIHIWERKINVFKSSGDKKVISSKIIYFANTHQNCMQREKLAIDIYPLQKNIHTSLVYDSQRWK